MSKAKEQVASLSPKSAFDQKYQEKLAQYAANFRIEDLNDANDKSLFDIMLKTEIMISDMQAEIQNLIGEGMVENATNIKKLSDLLRDATTTITNLQRTLAIDRKTRKQEETGSVADYIRTLKRNASAFLDQRLDKIYCPSCNVMIARFSAIHGHTAFNVSVQCSQCGKLIRRRRDARDVLYDVKDPDWRREHRVEIIQPRIKAAPIDEPTDEVDEFVITADPSFTMDPVLTEKPTEIGEDLEVEHGTETPTG